MFTFLIGLLLAPLLYGDIDCVQYWFTWSSSYWCHSDTVALCSFLQVLWYSVQTEISKLYSLLAAEPIYFIFYTLLFTFHVTSNCIPSVTINGYSCSCPSLIHCACLKLIAVGVASHMTFLVLLRMHSMLCDRHGRLPKTGIERRRQRGSCVANSVLLW